MSQPTYKYEPIDLDKTAIRLVRIHGGQYDSPIYCEIEQVLLGDEGVPYHALSYTWGPNSLLQESINVVDPVDGTVRIMQITKSLFSALKHLRDPMQEKRLWADGVCIDQNNPKERAHQVSQMRRVYSEAERVIIWLGDFASGDPDDNTASDIDVLMKYAHRLDKLVISGKPPPSGTEAWQEQLRREGADAWALGKMTSAMQTLLHNPWFKRVWIIQEVVSARSAVVVCGDNGYANPIPTRTFVLLPSVLGLKPGVQSQSILDVMPLSKGKRKGDWIRGVNLQTLLVKFQDSQCSEQRDFIYALLGMAADGRIIVPNYETREEAVFANVLSYFLFGKIVDPKDCPLPGNKNVLIKALTDPCGLSHHILLWALTHSHHATTIRILELANEHIDAKGIIEISPDTPPPSINAANTNPASTSVKKKMLSHSDERDRTAPLHMATAQGKINIVRRLLARPGVNVNVKNHAGDTPLSIAVFRRDTDMVRFFLTRKDVNVNAANGRGETPLSIIISRGDRKMARILLARRDVKINTGKNGCGPLSGVLAKHDWAMAQLLLQHGADVQPARKTESTPLMEAVSNNNTIAVRILLRHAQIISARRNADGEALRAEVLAAAIHEGNEEIVTLLLEHSDASQFSELEATNLWIAADSSGQERVAELLLEHNAPVNLDSNEGTNTLMKAVKHHQFAVIDRLLRYGANVNRGLSASTPPTPLTLAIHLRNIDMVKKLIECGADINYMQNQLFNFSPLYYAASRGDPQIVDLLMKDEKINIHATEQSERHSRQDQASIGSMALQASILYGHEQVFERLWELMAPDVDVNQQDYRPWHLNMPLLGTAAAEGRLSIAKKIVTGAHGKVDLNLTDISGGFTPLKQAARRGDADFVQWLLQTGRDEIGLECAGDRADGTALWCAVDALSYEAAEVLLERGANPDVQCFGTDYDHSPEYVATPLWRAAYKGSAYLAELLLSNGAKIGIKGRAKWQSLTIPSMSRPHSPLTQAAYGGHAEVIRLLVKYGARPSEVDEINGTHLRSKLKGFIQKAVEDENVLSFHRVLEHSEDIS